MYFRVFFSELLGHYWRCITNMVKGFLVDMRLRYITRTNLVLIPKKEFVSSFRDLRMISLSIFVNKIILRMIHGRIAETLPSVISNNQIGFIKGRSITKNVLLDQEIVIDINRCNKWHNEVVKLNMSKDFDKVSWKF